MPWRETDPTRVRRPCCKAVLLWPASNPAWFPHHPACPYGLTTSDPRATMSHGRDRV